MRFFIILLFITRLATAQFAPPQGQAGTTAMYKDSSDFVAWATWAKITRGLQDISNTSSGYASVGDSTSALGIADGNIVSLGDGGYAVCTFTNVLFDGEGYDFAVFENSFDGNYLELGFIEVSSDGINFFRFPATSNTQDTSQTGAFDYTDATKLNNLAGKYIAQYGTPFDLSEMKNINGLDVNHITHVKIIDVVGSLNNLYASHDKNNNKVNDPWPTPFASGGFDLDAIGAIHIQSNNDIEQLTGKKNQVLIYPNPAKETLNVSVNTSNIVYEELKISDLLGNTIIQLPVTNKQMVIDISNLSTGIYFLQLENSTQKFIISK